VTRKEKKRIHRRALTVNAYTVGKVQPYSPALMEESRAKLAELARTDKERILLEEAKNKVESYTYYIKNKLVDDEENVNKVSTEEQRAHVAKLAEEAEEWMYEDGATADLATTADKYAEIFEPAEKIFERVRELTARPEAVEAIKSRLTKVGELMTKWETTMPQVTEEERGDVVKLVEAVTTWIAEKEEAQAKVKPHEDPAFTSAEVPVQMKPIEVLVARLKR
jgi:hypoxia up-regulated 1